ncbi:MAG: 6-phosphogluconolactonase [Planctomycetota bacterium]|jgi:glucosamine-6-phosphate deaminase
MNYGKTEIIICDDYEDLGKKSAGEVADKIRELQETKEEVSIIFAAGESQMTFHKYLVEEADIDWQKVVCFNMDDFWDERMPEEYTCGYQTKTCLYEKVNPKRFELVRFNAPDPQAEAERFAGLMQQNGTFDILTQGIGTSGHLALDEPYQADFATKELVKVVDVDEQSKKQLIADPNFMKLGYIPAKGITMTIPAMLAADNAYTIVPLGLKRNIVEKVLSIKEPTTEVPATILSKYKGKLFLDRDSCPADLQSM